MHARTQATSTRDARGNDILLITPRAKRRGNDTDEQTGEGGHTASVVATIVSVALPLGSRRSENRENLITTLERWINPWSYPYRSVVID